MYAFYLHILRILFSGLQGIAVQDIQSYIKARDEKQALEMALMKEKEIALQSQLNSLKLQINPHFMFNNFNNLLELIEEDTELAGKFLSKTYRKCTDTSSPIWTAI